MKHIPINQMFRGPLIALGYVRSNISIKVEIAGLLGKMTSDSLTSNGELAHRGGRRKRAGKGCTGRESRSSKVISSNICLGGRR